MSDHLPQPPQHVDATSDADQKAPARVGSGAGLDQMDALEKLPADASNATPPPLPSASPIHDTVRMGGMTAPSDVSTMMKLFLSRENKGSLENFILLIFLNELDVFRKFEPLIWESAKDSATSDFSASSQGNAVFAFIREYWLTFGATAARPAHLDVYEMLFKKLYARDRFVLEGCDLRERLEELLATPKSAYLPYLLEANQIISQWLEIVHEGRLICKAQFDSRTRAELPAELTKLRTKFSALRGEGFDWQSASDLSTKSIVLPMEIVEGMFRIGEVVVVSAPSKSGKTWGAVSLGLSVATGHEWLGRKVRRSGAVLYCNLELGQEAFESRVHRVCSHYNDFPCKFYGVHLRGRTTSVDELLPHLVTKAKSCGAVMIVIDALYNVLGDRDENSNGEMAEFMASLTRLAVETACAVVVVHHHSKHGSRSDAGGPSANRMSGAGAIHRAPEGIITFSPATSEFPDDFLPGNTILRVDCSLRTLPEPEPFYVTKTKTDPVFSVLDAMPAKKEGADSKRARAMANWIGDKTFSLKDLKAGFCEHDGCKERSFDSALKRAIELDLLFKSVNGRISKPPVTSAPAQITQAQ